MTTANPRLERWTHPSVLALTRDQDPVAILVERARGLVRQAMDAGWSGPPFDPIALAELLKIAVVPRDDVADARTVPTGRSGVRIEFNPNRPPNRVRYSVAHEIAHTLFPDCADRVRNRAAHHELTGDDWQLEALCNIGAAELLMPAGSLHDLAGLDLHLEGLLEQRARYAVSTEAMLIRATRMSEIACAMFCASRIDHGSRKGRYRIDYVIGSPNWAMPVVKGTVLPDNSAVEECVAIGFTAAGMEQWADVGVDVQCVGIPGYPGRLYPRVVGMLRPRISEETSAEADGPRITYVRGDATKPRGKGPRIVAHIVNDATVNWGGHGFASALRRAFPEAQEDFRRQVAGARNGLALGQHFETQLGSGVRVFHMIAQRGYGPSPKPRIRYTALDTCLSALSVVAANDSASVHMPRIGTGEAGGAWDVVRDMILEHLCARGVPVTVYDLPGRRVATPPQPSLEFSR